jgi:hypothetical protein
VQKIAADLTKYVPGALCDDMAMIAVRREEPSTPSPPNASGAFPPS